MGYSKLYFEVVNRLAFQGFNSFLKVNAMLSPVFRNLVFEKSQLPYRYTQSI